MRLKGTFAKKLKGKDKKVKQETLKRMEKNREIDSNRLRDILKNKLAWAIGERQKGIKEIEKLKAQVLKLEGIVLFIQDLMKPKEEEKK